jgi:hypothetical protein
MVWRRLLVRCDSTIADLHYTLQIAFGWTDSHLHCFRIHGKEYGVAHIGGNSFTTDPRQVRLEDFNFRVREYFLYDYDFYDLWRHEVRVERVLEREQRKSYPVCVGGSRAGPLEDCGGPLAYMKLCNHHQLNPPLQELSFIADMLSRVLDAKENETIRDVIGDLDELQEAMDRLETYQHFQPGRFDRREVNRRLKCYARGERDWLL